MKKGILSTILVIQLILLLVFTISQLEYEKENFAVEQQFQRISAIKISSSFNNINRNVENLKNMNATDETFNLYINYVNNTYENIYFSHIFLNESYLKISDYVLEMSKEGLI